MQTYTVPKEYVERLERENAELKAELSRFQAILEAYEAEEIRGNTGERVC